MKLDDTERQAIKTWMETKGLSLQAAGDLLGVTDSAVMNWLKSGGVRSAQRVKLLEHIRPYITGPRQLGDSILDQIEAPDEIALNNRLLRIERYLQSQSVDLSRFDDKKFPGLEVAEPRASYGGENRAYRDHDAPLRLAAGGGIPQAPTLARTANIDGESMEPLFKHGEDVEISHFREPITLGQEGYMDFDYIKRLLNGHKYFFCQLGEDGLTVKGIELSPPNERGHWLLSLVAENKHWGEEFGYQDGRRVLRFGEKLQIYGTVKKRG